MMKLYLQRSSKAFNNEFELSALKFRYNKKKNILNAEKNVKFLDSNDNTTIYLIKPLI